MKKFFVLLFLMAVISFSVSARKSYIYVHNFGTSLGSSNLVSVLYLTGDVPKGIPDCIYKNEGTINEYVSFRGSEGILLNRLSELGYEVELMDERDCLLSKEIPSNQTQIEGDVNNDGEVTISDVNKVINIILGIVRENPNLLEQYGIIKPE